MLLKGLSITELSNPLLNCFIELILLRHTFTTLLHYFLSAATDEFSVVRFEYDDGKETYFSSLIELAQKYVNCG